MGVQGDAALLLLACNMGGFAGVLVCWCAGVLVCWCAGLLVISTWEDGFPMARLVGYVSTLGFMVYGMVR